MTDTIPITPTIDGVLSEYAAHASLLDGLTDEEWTTPTRCAGWVVRDVLAHVVGLASDSFNGRVGQSTPDEQAAQRRDAKPGDLAAELREVMAAAEPLLRSVGEEQWAGPSGAPDLTLAEGVRTLWYDAWVHRDDVLAALGRPHDTGPGLQASVADVRMHLDRRGWAPPAGVDVDAIDTYQFVLAATGRIPGSAVGLDDTVNIYA